MSLWNQYQGFSKLAKKFGGPNNLIMMVIVGSATITIAIAVPITKHFVKKKLINVKSEDNLSSLQDYKCGEVNIKKVGIITVGFIDKDIALLKLDEFFSENIIELSESNPKTSDLCYSFANANGLGISLYDGLISNPSIELIVDGCSQKYIQSNLPAYPGCSGGCLLDKNGFCIGMVSFRIKDKNGDPIIDFSYSIPSNTLGEEINNILGESLK